MLGNMNKLVINLVFVAGWAVVCFASAPPVQQCENANFEGLSDRIKIDPCSTTKCKLPKEANVTVAFTIKPTKQVRKLDNNVYALIAGIPFPFLGTHGTSACGDVRTADTDEAAACPLQPGREYVYKNTFYIYSFYPATDLVVHWSLDDGDRQVICFDVPAAIVKAKTKRN